MFKVYIDVEGTIKTWTFIAESAVEAFIAALPEGWAWVMTETVFTL